MHWLNKVPYFQITDVSPIATHRRAVIATAQSDCRRWDDAKRNVKIALQLQFFAEDMDACLLKAFGSKPREEIVAMASQCDIADLLNSEVLFLRKQNAHFLKWAREEYFFANLAQSSNYGYEAVKHFECESYLEGHGDEDMRAKFQKARKDTAKEFRGRGSSGGRGGGTRRGRGGYSNNNNNSNFNRPRGGYSSFNKGNSNFIRPVFKCIICKKPGHTADRCFTKNSTAD